MLALIAGAATCAVWQAGLIDSLQAAFIVTVAHGEAPLQKPQTWLGLLLIVGQNAFAAVGGQLPPSLHPVWEFIYPVGAEVRLSILIFVEAI